MEEAYICAAISPRNNTLSSLTTDYPLRDAGIRQCLFKEVKLFWDTLKHKKLWKTTAFQDNEEIK